MATIAAEDFFKQFKPAKTPPSKEDLDSFARKNETCRVDRYISSTRSSMKAITEEIDQRQKGLRRAYQFEGYLKLYRAGLEVDEKESWFPLMEMTLNVLDALRAVPEDEERWVVEAQVIGDFLSMVGE